MMMKRLSNKKKSSWQNFLLQWYGKTTEIVVGLLCGEGDVCGVLPVFDCWLSTSGGEAFCETDDEEFPVRNVNPFFFFWFFGFWVFGLWCGCWWCSWLVFFLCLCCCCFRESSDRFRLAGCVRPSVLSSVNVWLTRGCLCLWWTSRRGCAVFVRRDQEDE